MNSIERVRAAVHFGGPDRVPVCRPGLADVLFMPMLPSKRWSPGGEPHERGLFPFHYDDTWVKLGMWRWKKPDWAKAPRFRNWLELPREEVDEFGAIWVRDGEDRSMGHPGRPALPDWSGFDEYFERYSPDAADRTRYSDFLRVAKLVGRKRYRLALLGFQGPFTTAGAIRGFTGFLTDHRRNPEMVSRLLARLSEFYVTAARSWVKYGGKPHGFMLYDDLGDQYRPFMSPDMFADFYEPVFRSIADTAHELGCDIHLHSCGKIDLLIPLLIEWGFDSLEFDSPRTIGFDDLEPFGGEVAMWGCVDIQRVYATGTPEECEREVWRMMRHMGTPEGGYVAYMYPQPRHIGAPKENIRAFERGLRKYGDYSRIPPGWWEEPAEAAFQG